MNDQPTSSSPKPEDDVDNTPNFYREDGEDGRWMCSTCKSEVFGGICDCLIKSAAEGSMQKRIDLLDRVAAKEQPNPLEEKK